MQKKKWNKETKKQKNKDRRKEWHKITYFERHIFCTLCTFCKTQYGRSENNRLCACVRMSFFFFFDVKRDMMEEFDDGLPQRRFDNVRNKKSPHSRTRTHRIFSPFQTSLWSFDWFFCLFVCLSAVPICGFLQSHEHEVPRALFRFGSSDGDSRPVQSNSPARPAVDTQHHDCNRHL